MEEKVTLEQKAQEALKKIGIVSKHMLSTISTLFLNTIFYDPEFIKGEISKHFGVPVEDVKLTYERNTVDENGEELYKVYTLIIFENEFILRFDKRVEQPKTIKIPKVVNQPKKWWQSEPDKTVVVEEKATSDTPRIYWVLSSIS